MRRSGFTLVELSIVLVIIGLLTGGVLTGQSLIRAAELRSVTSQYSRYVTAVQTFRDKYFALPGDMTNATSFWGMAAAGTACVTTASTDSKTCDGNGDWLIASSTNSSEYFRFWQQLANAGLIEGSYDGTAHGSIPWAAGPGNAPAGRLNNSYWHVWNFGVQSGASYVFDGFYGNSFEFGSFKTNDDPLYPILKPEEAYNIDQKMDDGKPATGKIVIRGPTIASCTDTSSSSNINANYQLTNSSVACALFFRQLF